MVSYAVFCIKVKRKGTVQDKNFPFDEIPDRQTALALHKRLRETKAPLIDMGRFYLFMVEQGRWATQKTMASDLGVSTAQVSRLVAAARLPEELLELFANKALVFSDIATLHMLVRQFGKTEIANRAKGVPLECSLEDIFSILTTGKKPPRKGVRISIVRGQKYLRVDVPKFAQIAPQIRELEQIFNILLSTGSNARVDR
jgi:hypothetical protein